MVNRSVVALSMLVILDAAASVPAQQPKERSHVERFSTPEAKAGREESEASAKLAANPNDDQALNARAIARIRLGRYHEAFEDARRAVSLKPADSDYQANLGYVLWKLGRPEEAINAERAALKLNPKNTTAHYQLGRFLLRLGQQKDLNEAVGE